MGQGSPPTLRWMGGNWPGASESTSAGTAAWTPSPDGRSVVLAGVRYALRLLDAETSVRWTVGVPYALEPPSDGRLA